jgi:hypothetical protein
VDHRHRLATATSIHFAGSRRYAFAPNACFMALLIALLAATLVSNFTYDRSRVF